MIVFDLDGTLVETMTANFHAYRAVGEVPPNDFHQVPWQSWTSKEMHDAKNKVLPQYMGVHAKETPLMDVARELGDRCLIVSNISEEALGCLRDYIDLREFNIKHGLNIAEKIKVIREVGGSIYFDDAYVNCVRVKYEANCKVVYHYHNNNLIEVH